MLNQPFDRELGIDAVRFGQGGFIRVSTLTSRWRHKERGLEYALGYACMSPCRGWGTIEENPVAASAASIMSLECGLIYAMAAFP